MDDVVARALSLAPPARAGVIFARSNPPLQYGDCFVGKITLLATT
jgi:hypothetical protein